MTRIKFRVSALFALSLLLIHVGCTTPAQKLEEPAVTSQLRKGQTQEDVRRLFGQPRRSEAGSTGKKLDVFIVVIPVSTMTPIRTTEVRSLHVLYDSHGQLEEYCYCVGESKGMGGRFSGQWQTGVLSPQIIY